MGPRGGQPKIVMWTSCIVAIHSLGVAMFVVFCLMCGVWRVCRYENIQNGEPAELLVLSNNRKFDRFKVRSYVL